jgi:hypothetical protein
MLICLLTQEIWWNIKIVQYIIKVKKVRRTPVQALRLCTDRTASIPLLPVGGLEVEFYTFLTKALEVGEGSASRPGRYLPP